MDNGQHNLEMDEAMPAGRAMYPPLPAYYRDAQFQLIYFRIDPSLVRAHLPPPLVPDPEGMAMALGLWAPTCTYGSYAETSLRLRCQFNGQSGFYTSHQHVNNVAVLCAGRERWGAPKEYAEVAFEQCEDQICTRTTQEGIEIMRLTTRIIGPATENEMIPTGLSFRLKIIPRADAPGPAIKQLISYTAQESKTKQLHSASADLSFSNTEDCKLADFAPLQIIGAFHQVMDLTEGHGRVEYDYL